VLQPGRVDESSAPVAEGSGSAPDRRRAQRHHQGGGGWAEVGTRFQAAAADRAHEETFEGIPPAAAWACRESSAPRHNDRAELAMAKTVDIAMIYDDLGQARDFTRAGAKLSDVPGTPTDGVPEDTVLKLLEKCVAEIEVPTLEVI